MSVFIDTGVFVAAANRSDHWHRRALDVWKRIGGEVAFTTNAVVMETWQRLNASQGRFRAMQFWTGLRDSIVRVEAISGSDLERAESIATSWPDQAFSIVDCTSFAIMERLGCARAATFDSDFAIYRYGADRRKAFEILS